MSIIETSRTPLTLTPDFHLGTLTANAAHRFGKKRALVTSTGELTFVEIEQRVASLAGGLEDLGIITGDRVILHLPNSWEWICAYYAVARIGAIVVPCNILLSAEEVRFIALDCQAVAIVAPGDRLRSLLTGEKLSSLRFCVAAGQGGTGDVIDFQKLFGARRVKWVPRGQVATDVSTIGYTSGTTGRSKGAALTHQAVVLNTALTANMHMRTSSDTVVTALPCAHVYGNVVMNGAFLCGYTLVLLERFDAENALHAIEVSSATLFEGVPTMYYYLLGAAGLARHNLRSLTRCTVGGQTMTLPQMKEIERVLGCPLIELWGMTEIAGLGTTHPILGPVRLGSIGRPLPFSECRIAGENPDDTASDDTPGELMFRGPTVMTAYYGNPAATAEVVRSDGWIHTGDIAHRDKHGYFYIVDRKKEMVITAGYNIYPSEIERVISEHPAVSMVAVGSIPDAQKGELAKAYVVLKSESVCTIEELLHYCKARLATYKVPRAIQFVPDLPKTSTGKILRRALSTLDVH